MFELRRARSSCLLVLLLLGFASVAFPQTKIREMVLDHGASDPQVSPDGSRIAVSILGKIWIVPSTGGEARQVSFGVSWDRHPAWSADGQMLAYAQHLPSGSDIVVQNLAPGTSTVIFHSANEIGQIAFNSAATEIFAVIERNQLEAHIVRIPSSGGEAKPITEAQGWHEWSFALAPNGKDIYLESGRYGGANLYKLDLQNRGVSRLTRATAADSNVNVTRDGSNLVFLETADATETVVIRPLAGGSERRIFSGDYNDSQLSLAPDSTWGVLRAGRKLYRLDLASGRLSPIPFTARFSAPSTTRGDLVIKHARLPGASDAIEIEIQDGRIKAVRHGDSPPPKGAPVLDAAGKFVLSGLMDNHYHYWDPFDGGRLLAQGITTIRDPGAALSDSLNYKEAIALGLIPGPDIYACGPLIDGVGSYHPMVAVEVSTPEGARRLVRSLKANGVDALKLYFMLDPQSVQAAIQEAHALNLRTTGHIGVHTGWGEAMDDGIDGLNHIRVWRDVLPLDQQPQGENESLDASRNMIARMQANWDEIDPDGEAAGKIIASMRDHKVGFDPTLSIQIIPNELRANLSLEDFEIAHGSYDRMSKFVARAYKSGVTILAGTDNGSLFDELESYAKAGVPPAGILAAVTINGARWLGEDSDFGSIDAGRRADLVLLNDDPMKDIKNVRHVAVVIKNGQVVARNDVATPSKEAQQ
jgi:hypothetical protein